MKQDRKTNGWIVIASIIEIFMGIVLLGAGGVTSAGGFLYIGKLNKLADLQFFLGQKWIKYVIDKFKWTPKYVYLYLGIALAVIGLVTLILGIISLAYAKKRKVVRKRGFLTLHIILAVAVAGCSAVYFIMERAVLPNNIKYVLYGVMGGFGFVAFCKLVGVVFGRSEQFLSNDNSKYSKSNRLIAQYISQQPRSDSARNVTPNTAVQRPSTPNTAVQRPSAPNTNNVQPARPTQMSNQAGMPPRPTSQTRPAGQQPRTMQGQMQNQARPTQTAMQSGVRPVRATQGQAARPTGSKYCAKCGKLLNLNEKICSLCGFRVSE